MAKFWKMAVAFFAMMSMVVVPVSCGDDDDDKDDKGNTSADGLGGRIFLRYSDNLDEDMKGGSEFHEAGLDFISFSKDGKFKEYGVYCLVEKYGESEQNLVLKVLEEGSYSVENSKLYIYDKSGKLDTDETEEFLIKKNGQTYDVWYDQHECKEVSESEMNKLVEEFKKAHTNDIK